MARDSDATADVAFNKWRWQWRRRIAIAQGQHPPALVLGGGSVLNVFTGELIDGDVAIDAGSIAGIGSFPEATDRIDVTGRVIAPSFIDPHIHMESSLLWSPEFARAVVPHGTGAIVTDPHEIANVAGLPGVAAFRDSCRNLPLNVFFSAPSSVPASPQESSGAEMSTADIEEMLGWAETVALGEVMNVPGVLRADAEIAARIWKAAGKPVDGHAPGVTGPAIQAYAGSGITSDHESTRLTEAHAKLRAGMMLMLREGSSEKNLLDLLPLVTDDTFGRICFASDDRDCHDLLAHGHVDDILRTAIRGGLDPVRGIRMATWNPAQHWRLPGLGAVAPGYRANLVILRDLETVDVEMTLFNGEVVARNGALTVETPGAAVPPILRDTVNIAPLHLSSLVLVDQNATRAVHVIPGQIVTRLIEVSPPSENGVVRSSVAQDLLKLVSVERHRATGRVGVGLVNGFGLRRGALASTIAHDAHNIVATGVSDTDILLAIATVAESQGGLAVVADGMVIAHVPLPVCGLISTEPAEQVAEAYRDLERAARELGCPLHSPFGQLAFLSLSVIPEARVTDRGFLDLR
ncbi:MAG: Adenine deaminase [uncultured Thermomicrobiales bacterium]|uniref:Adenine deaminase n=1 Tax=uncultured Thermomicrobiales bacterium TaxID=1645740 RepID=A0A6J4ULY5_9BACT|nr:MAG: Adenine deaminase [uncultured Thermomicrobiales bacterium]